MNPKLIPCPHCAGHGFVPTELDSLVTCPACGGGKLKPVFGELGETRTYKTRPFVYNPGTGELTVTRGKSRTDYTITEYESDPTPENPTPRAFRFEKKNRGGLVCERYYVCLGKPGLHRCTCPGWDSDAVEKGNKAAWKSGEPVRYPHSFGCVHLDSCLRLLWDGLLDAPKEVVEELVS